MVTSIIAVVAAVYEGEYRIHLRFNDGSSKTVDFSRWLHGTVFKPLAPVEEFQRFFIAGGTVCWPNGADIAPETLHAAQDVSATAA
jgi:hypothetical protein